MSLKSMTSFHTVTIQLVSESVATGGALGMIDAAPTTVRSDVECTAKELTTEQVEDLGKRGIEADWRVYFHANQNLDERNRIIFVDSSGVTHTLKVKKTVNLFQFDRFWKVDCQEDRDADNTAP